MIFIAAGQVMAMRSGNNKVYSEGDILGIDQFLFGSPWQDDLYASQSVTICKFKYESLANLANQNAHAASRLLKAIYRHYCKGLIL